MVRWAAYITELCSRRRSLPTEETQHILWAALSFDRCEATLLVVVGYRQITNSVDPFYWFPEGRYWSGLNETPSGTREDDRGAFGNWWWFSIHSSTVEGWGLTPGSWRTSSACGTWLWWSCRPRRELTRRGSRVKAYRWQADWRGQGSLRTLRTSDPGGTMRLCGLCNLMRACKGGDRSRQYRRLWPLWGKLRLLASFRRSS